MAGFRYALKAHAGGSIDERRLYVPSLMHASYLKDRLGMCSNLRIPKHTLRGSVAGQCLPRQLQSELQGQARVQSSNFRAVE